MLPPKEEMDKMRQQRANQYQQPAEPPMEQEPVLRAEGFGPPNFTPPPPPGAGLPNFDDMPPTFDNDDLEHTYAQFEGSQLEQPYDDDAQPQLNEEYPEEDVSFETPPQWEGTREHPVPPSLRQPGGRFLRDEAIFPGGPSRSELASWKKQFEIEGHGVYMTDHLDEVFIWRSLNREEYREIMALPNVDPLQREEIICEICMLFPYEYNFSSMASKLAGTPAVVAQQIMEKSGFKKASPAVRL